MTCNNLTLYPKTTGVPPDIPSMIAVTVFLVLLAFIGIFGNLVIIFVIAGSKHLKSVFNHLIISLCCSDLLSAVISFLRMWCFTWAACEPPVSANALLLACQIGWRITNWMTFNTALHITGFAAIRFASIKWPSVFHMFTEPRIKIFILSSWIISFVCGFVLVFFSTLRPDRMLAYVIVYLILSALMTLLCIGTAVLIFNQRVRRKRLAGKRVELSQAERHRRSKENQKVVQLALIIGSFLLGYVPRAVYNTTVINFQSTESAEKNWPFAVAQYFCVRVSECLNPVFYNIGCSDLYAETKRTLKSLRLRFACGNNPDDRGRVELPVMKQANVTG